MEAWINKLYETFIETEYYKLLLEGLGNTLIITAGALVIGVVIGMLIALIKFFAEDVPSLRPLSFICDLYVTVIRGIPVVVLLLIFYYNGQRGGNGGRHNHLRNKLGCVHG